MSIDQKIYLFADVGVLILMIVLFSLMVMKVKRGEITTNVWGMVIGMCCGLGWLILFNGTYFNFIKFKSVWWYALTGWIFSTLALLIIFLIYILSKEYLLSNSIPVLRKWRQWHTRQVQKIDKKLSRLLLLVLIILLL